MKAEGVEFVTNTDVGKDKKAAEILKDYDRVILACGASNPRDIKVPGREAEGNLFRGRFPAGHHQESAGFQFRGREIYLHQRKERDGHRRRRHRKRLCGHFHPSGRKIRHPAGNDAEGSGYPDRRTIPGPNGRRSARPITARRKPSPCSAPTRVSIPPQSRSSSATRRAI